MSPSVGPSSSDSSRCIIAQHLLANSLLPTVRHDNYFGYIELAKPTFRSVSAHKLIADQYVHDHSDIWVRQVVIMNRSSINVVLIDRMMAQRGQFLLDWLMA